MASAKNAGKLSKILDPALLVRPTTGASSTDPSLFEKRKSKFCYSVLLELKVELRLVIKRE